MDMDEIMLMDDEDFVSAYGETDDEFHADKDEIEDLKDKLENLSKNLKEALKKQKALNIIPESLCSKCGRSLEESFCGEGVNENQKIIKEQNDLIEKMKKEMNELRNKYNYSELRLKDLDEIKKEFENLSGVLLRPKNDNSTQTEDNIQNLNNSFFSNTTNENSNYNSKAKSSKSKNNGKNIQNKNKFTIPKKVQNQQKKVTNYNIININNNNNNTSFMSNTNNFLNSTNSNNSSMTNEGILSSERVLMPRTRA